MTMPSFKLGPEMKIRTRQFYLSMPLCPGFGVLLPNYLHGQTWKRHLVRPTCAPRLPAAHRLRASFVRWPSTDGVDSYYRFGGGKKGSMSPSADLCGSGGGGSNSR
ncbi:hypothetical protein BO443_20721 [Burkholderia orbicola]